jgi:methionyl-tRNA synthetase
VEGCSSKVGLLLDQFQLKVALASIIELARNGNQYLSEREPWHLIKTDRVKTATTLYLAAQLVRSIGILISPFLPETAQQIANQLNAESSVGWQAAGRLDLKPGHKIGKPKPLFHKITAPTPT